MLQLLKPKQKKILDSDAYIRSTNPLLWVPLYKNAGDSFTSQDGRGYTCTVTGAYLTSTGRVFDGSDDQVSLANPASLQIGAPLTVAVWVKATAADGGANHYLFSKGDALTDGWHLLQRDDGTWTFFFGTALHTGSAPVVNAWAFLVATDDGVNLTAYVNGVKHNATTASGMVANTTRTIRIGKYSSGNNLPFAGVIGDVLLYNYNFTAPGVQNLYRVTRWRY